MVVDFTKPYSKKNYVPDEHDIQPGKTRSIRNKDYTRLKILILFFLMSSGSIALVVFGLQTKTKKIMVFQDNFTTNKNGWIIKDTDNHKVEFIDGKYSIEILSENGYWMSWSRKLNLDKTKEINVEVSVQKKTDKTRNGYGLYYAGKGSQEFYTFAISHTGYYTVYHYNGKKIIYDIPWKKSKFIKLNNRENRLKLSIQKDHILYFINNTKVASLPRHQFYGDRYGFKVDGMQKVNFDDFEIYYSIKTTYLEIFMLWVEKIMT